MYVEFDDNDARSGGPRAEYAGGVAPMDNMMPATIKVLGCGGGGSNAVNRMAMAGLR